MVGNGQWINRGNPWPVVVGFVPGDEIFSRYPILTHMAYQKNWPTLLAYTVAVIGFFALAAYAVMYATGYRLDIETWTIKKTGVLAITSKPSGATVTINDMTPSRKTPLTLRNALPGAYHIKLTLDGYQPYEKDVEVISNQATEEHNIDMVLAEIKSTSVANDITAVLDVDTEIWAFTQTKHFVKLGPSATDLNIDKMPTNVKTVLAQTTGLYLAKRHETSNNIALGIMVGSKRWLAIIDPAGYRGQLFGTPLNQVSPENLSWIDADRLMLLIGSSLYTLDLALNQTSLYAKSVTGATYTNGKMYYITRDSHGQFVLYRDSNPFDERPAESIFTNLPVARAHEILVTPEDEIAVLAVNPSSRGLWLLNKSDAAADLRLSKLASNVQGTLYDYLGEQLFFVVGRMVNAYDFAKQTSTALRQFADTPTLIGKRNESVFIKSTDKFFVTDPSFSNVYELVGAKTGMLLLGLDSHQVWLLVGTQLSELTLRHPGQGLFGALPGWLMTTAGS
ncbi:TPA: hypothetical protein DIU46_02600 [Patescibacteria group bacterium]|nr:hypothetical protein [Patescibacteria group bacterium]HCR42831.1 hypothetical protein [Patescibacteria group bacterium]